MPALKEPAWTPRGTAPAGQLPPPPTTVPHTPRPEDLRFLLDDLEGLAAEVEYLRSVVRRLLGEGASQRVYAKVPAEPPGEGDHPAGCSNCSSGVRALVTSLI